jgi:D-beta-D-heptose 7-phosphate kinase/D-beta-D-heptose 1-phosphate adenosyltransferase
LTKSKQKGKKIGKCLKKRKNKGKLGFLMQKQQDIAENIASYIDEMIGKKVLIIGDIMIDRFIYGSVNRMSPEAPVPVLHANKQEDVLGGAGNVLSNLFGLKIECQILSVAGEDEDHNKLKKLIERYTKDSAGIFSDTSRVTTVKNRFLDEKQHLLRVDQEITEDISIEIQNKIIAKFKELVEEINVVILSDYGKGVLTEELNRSIIDLANESNVPVLVDPKGYNYKKYEGAYLVTPNLKELSEATGGVNVDTDETVLIAMSKLKASSGIKNIVATRSQDGISVLEENEGSFHIRTKVQEVFDVTGAGDTVIATLAASLAAGAPLIDAALLSNLAGGIAVSKMGTVSIDSEDLKKVAKQNDIRKNIHEVA